MLKKESVRYALISTDRKVVIDFGESQSTMLDYVKRQKERFGESRTTFPAKITTTEVIEAVEL